MAFKILMRLKPCRCGCQGKDPWHQKYIKREVYGVVPLPAPIKVFWSRPDMVGVEMGEYRLQGMAKFPWGEKPVFGFYDNIFQEIQWQIEMFYAKW